MHHTLLLSKDKTWTRYALLDENKQPIEFGIDHPTQRNAIYKARVLDIKPAFGMVFFDLSPHFTSPGLFSTTPAQAQNFQNGQVCFVQVLFAPFPIKTSSFLRIKGPKVTPELRFSCPYFIYFPQTPGLFFSKRLKKKKVESSLPLLKPLLSPQEGLILRPQCEQATPQSLQTYLKDMKEKVQRYLNKKEILSMGACLYEPPSSLFQKLEEIGFSLSKILIDDRSLFEDVKNFIEEYQISCTVEFKVKNPLQESLFQFFSVEDMWDESLSSFVPLPLGGNLIIEKTEGFWAVDINSQGREGIISASTPKILNKEAAKALFHAIRLRNLSGKIVVDFLPLPQKEDWQDFYLFLKKQETFDSTSLKVSFLNPSGLCEIMREKRDISLLEAKQFFC